MAEASMGAILTILNMKVASRATDCTARVSQTNQINIETNRIV